MSEDLFSLARIGRVAVSSSTASSLARTVVALGRDARIYTFPFIGAPARRGVGDDSARGAREFGTPGG